MDKQVYSREYYEKNKEKMRAYYREYARKWRAENKEKHQINFRRNYPSQYAKKLATLEALAGRAKPATCEICGGADKISFDHDHTTGKFRGWLCGKCNSVLGFVKDSPAILNKLALYLEDAKVRAAAPIPSFISDKINQNG